MSGRVAELGDGQVVEVEKSGASLNRHKSKQDYATPWGLVRMVERRFGRMAWDLACTRANAKAAAGYYHGAADALAESWHLLAGGVCWLNPPFADIGPWARKAAEEAARGARVLMLTPASVGANWYRDFVHHRAHVFFLNGRITFEGSKDVYPKDCMITAFGFGMTGWDVWTFHQGNEEKRALTEGAGVVAGQGVGA